MNSNLGPQFDPHPDVIAALSSRIHSSSIPKHLHGAVENEMARNGISNPVPLYRGGKPSKSKFLGYTEHKALAEHFAKVTGGEVHTLPAGSVRGLRINDYPTQAPSDDVNEFPDRSGEKEWLIHKSQIKE
jgi:hypothetical protein